MAETATPLKAVLDFTNVKENSGINPKHRPAGDYRVKIAKVIANKSNAGNNQWVFTLVPTDMLSAAYPYYCTLNPDSLWKVRNLLIACGIDVPKKKLNVDPTRLIGKEIGVTLDDDEYEGKMKSVITAVFPSSDLDDESVPAQDDDDAEVEAEVEEDPEPEPEPEPAAKPATKRKPAAKPAPEPEPEVGEDELDELELGLDDL
jgi:hypothetical protein